MEFTLIMLGLALLPWIVSCGGRGGVWKFLAFLFCLLTLLLTLGSLLFTVLLAFATVPAFVLWVIAWIFAGVALGSAANERRFQTSSDIRVGPRVEPLPPNRRSSAKLYTAIAAASIVIAGLIVAGMALSK